MERPLRRLFVLFAACVAAGCSKSPSAAVAISVPSDAPQGLQDSAQDAAQLLGQLMHTTVEVKTDASAKQLIKVTLNDSKCGAAGKGAEAYAIKNGDEGEIDICSDGQLGAEFGLYALLEQNGLRFFHPEETYVPATAPAQLSVKEVVATPSMPHRGFHLHTVHPIPMLAALHFGGSLNQKLVDDYLRYLVRNRQDYLQWALITVPNMDGAFQEAKYTVDRGHALGLTVGINPLLWGANVSNLQHDYTLVPDPTATDWQTTLHSHLDSVMSAGFDLIDLSLGEFQQSSDTALVQWINETQSYVKSKWPNTKVVWSSHVGDVGDSPNYHVYYYFVPQFCTNDVGLFVHTTMLYDLNDPAPCYNQTDFHLQRDFLLQEVNQRETWFYPEDAYWLTTDSPIPYFMSAYLQGRSNDLAWLKQNAPGLQGQVIFTTADEWGYWLFDFLNAHETYDGPESVDQFLSDTFAALGPSGADLGHAIASESAVQWEDLVNKNLLPYVAGEDSTDKLGYANGIWNHYPRVPFTTILSMTADDLNTFESVTLAGVQAMAQHEQTALSAVQALKGKFDDNAESWRQEFEDGYQINTLRAQHSAALYQAAIAAARSKLDGQDRSAEIAADRAQASALTTQAAAVVARREAHYRYGTSEISSGPNPTEYPYGAEYNAHMLTFWTSQESDLADALAQ